MMKKKATWEDMLEIHSMPKGGFQYFIKGTDLHSASKAALKPFAEDIMKKRKKEGMDIFR